MGHRRFEGPLQPCSLRDPRTTIGLAALRWQPPAVRSWSATSRPRRIARECQRQEESAMLLTGFESYGGRSLNPAEQVVKRLAGTEIGGVRVSGHTLPVNYAELGARIARLIEEVRPRAVICLGLWPGHAAAAARADRGQHRGLRDPGQCRAHDARPRGRRRRRGLSQHAADPCDPGPAAGRGHSRAALRQRRDVPLQRADVPCAPRLRRACAGRRPAASFTCRICPSR